MSEMKESKLHKVKDILMTASGNLRENDLSLPIAHALRMGLCEQLHKAWVLGEAINGVLHERDILGFHGCLARELVPEVEINPQVEVV